MGSGLDTVISKGRIIQNVSSGLDLVIPVDDDDVPVDDDDALTPCCR